MVTIIGAVCLLQEDEGLTIVRAGTVEFQAGEFGLEVKGVAGFGFHFGFNLSLTILLLNSEILEDKKSALGIKPRRDGGL